MKKRNSLAVLSGLVTLTFISLISAQDIGTLLQQSRTQIQSEQWEDAHAALTQLLSKDPGNAAGNFMMAKVSFNRDDLKGAQDKIKMALEADAGNSEFRAFAEKVDALTKALKAASLAESQRQYQDAIDQFERIATQYPNLAYANFGLGRALMRSGDTRQAAKAFRDAIAKNPRDKRYSQSLRRLVNEKFNEGHNAYRSKDYAAAASLYQEAYELDPGFHQAYYRQGLSAYRDGDIRAAIASYDRCISIQPDYIPAYIQKGNVLRREGETDEAVSAYEAAIAIDPNADDAWVGLGIIQKAVDIDNALANFKRAVAADDKNFTAHEYLGEIYSDKEDWLRAKKHLIIAVSKKNPSHVTTWRLAVVYNNIKDWPNARIQAMASTKKNRNFAYGWYELGIAENALGNRQAAIAAFRFAVKGRDASLRKSAKFELDKLESNSQ